MLWEVVFGAKIAMMKSFSEKGLGAERIVLLIARRDVDSADEIGAWSGVR